MNRAARRRHLEEAVEPERQPAAGSMDTWKRQFGTAGGEARLELDGVDFDMLAMKAS